MEGLGLDNMLSAESVEKLFGEDAGTIESAEAPEPTKEEEVSGEVDNKESEKETAEVDFSDLLGNQSESVGSEESEVKGEAPKSKNDTGAPNPNLFSSIAKALRDEGVFPDLSDETLTNIKDAGDFRKLFDDQVANSLTERQKRIEEALNGGASTEEARAYQNDLSIVDFLNASETSERLENEDEDGETLRKQVMYQDYINRGFSEERAKKLVQKSLDDGTDIDDAREALQSCREFYQARTKQYQDAVENRRKSIKENEEKEFANLKKQIVDTDNFFGGIKVDKNTRLKAYESLTKPVYKDKDGNFLTALQKYQRENPADFMKNVALMYSLTDGFKNVDKIVKPGVKAGMKKGFAELESVLNNTRRNSDGTLNLANTSFDDNRENWELAI